MTCKTFNENRNERTALLHSIKGVSRGESLTAGSGRVGPSSGTTRKQGEYIPVTACHAKLSI